MHQECENLKSEYNYNVAEYKLREVFNEFKTEIEREFIDYRVNVTNRITNLFNNHDNFRDELQNQLSGHQDSINQQFEEFRQYLLDEFSSFKFGTQLVERLNNIEEHIDNLSGFINIIETNITNLNNTLLNEIQNNTNNLLEQIQNQSNYNEETFFKKSTFNNQEDGVLLVNNGNIVKLDKPEVPSVLTFDGNEFKWQPYKEYEI